MKRVIVLIIVFLVVVSGVGLWFFTGQNESLNVSTNNIKTVTTNKSSNTIDGKWINKQQEDSFVGYEIKEILGGDTIKKTASGKTSDVTSSFTITNSTLTNATITADMTTLTSDVSRRDNTQRNSGLETAKFPKATFQQSEDKKIEPTKNTDQKVDLPGNLTLHGVTKFVTIPVTAKWNGKTITVSGEIDILLSDYDIDSPNTGFVKVDDNGKIKFQLLYVPQS